MMDGVVEAVSSISASDKEFPKEKEFRQDEDTLVELFLFFPHLFMTFKTNFVI